MTVVPPTSRSLQSAVALVAILATMIAVATASQQPVNSSSLAPVQAVDTKREYAVKSVYVFNFARYVKWPLFKDGRAKEFRIGVIGQSPIVAPLTTLAKRKSVRDRRTGSKLPLRILQFRTLKEYQDCHILVVPRNTPLQEQRAITKRLATKPVLLVGETAGFAQAEGTAGFLLMNGGVQFDLNVADAKRKRLTLDAKLLKAARILNEKVKPHAITNTNDQSDRAR